MHFWSFWAKYWHFLPISSHARPKTNVNKVPRWVFRYVGNKTFDFSSKKRIFCPKTTQFGPKLAFLSIAGSFGALLVSWLVVVARAVSCKTPIYFYVDDFLFGVWKWRFGHTGYFQKNYRKFPPCINQPILVVHIPLVHRALRMAPTALKQVHYVWHKVRQWFVQPVVQFGQALDQMGQKCRYLAQNASLGQIWPFLGPKSNFLGSGSKNFGTLVSGFQWDTFFVLKTLIGEAPIGR